MLSEEEKDLTRRSLDAVRQGMPGFTSRQPQLRMMATAAHPLAAIGDASAREEGTPPDEHPYGRKVVYMDTAFPRIYQAEMYDKKGQFWKFSNWHHSVVAGKDGFRAIGPLQGEQVDVKARKATIFVGNLRVNEPMAADDVTLGKLEAAGR